MRAIMSYNPECEPRIACAGIVPDGADGREALVAHVAERLEQTGAAEAGEALELARRAAGEGGLDGVRFLPEGGPQEAEVAMPGGEAEVIRICEIP